MDNKYIVFVIYAYEYKVPETGTLFNACTLELISDSANLAIERAKRIIPDKKHYEVSRVIEKYK